MPVILQRAHLTRAQLRSQPDRLFAWGDNLARVGGANNPRSGQAYACRGEPNAIGIPTKHRPSWDEDAFFTDADFERAIGEIDTAMDALCDHVRNGGTVVWPADGIGTGRAQLPKRAPRIWERLERAREALFAIDGVIDG